MREYCLHGGDIFVIEKDRDLKGQGKRREGKGKEDEGKGRV